LKAGETKTAHGKVYIVENDLKKLLLRYQSDFPPKGRAAVRKTEPPHEASAEEGWRIDLFEPITDDEAKGEKKLYSELLEAWRQGNGLQGLLLSTKELALHPGRDELHLLRAASVLLELGKASAPLVALKGELPTEAIPTEAIPTKAGSPEDDPLSGQDDLVMEALSFALEEYQRAFPEPPPDPAPWTGLYHPFAQKSLAGSLLSFWSHGLRPLLRLEALSRGRLETFKALEDPRPSLVDVLLEAQVLAARGEKEKGTALLESDLKSLVAPESWPSWKARIKALSLLCDSLSSEDLKHSARLKNWADETRAAIPGIGKAMITLPARALRALEENATPGRKERKSRREFAPPDGQRLSEMLFQRRAKLGPRRAELSSADREVMEALHRSLLRLRDFRADVLRRFESGDPAVILSADLLRDGELSFLEEGKRRVSLGRSRRTLAQLKGALQIPCGQGFWLLLE